MIIKKISFKPSNGGFYASKRHLKVVVDGAATFFEEFGSWKVFAVPVGENTADIIRAYEAKAFAPCESPIPSEASTPENDGIERDSLGNIVTGGWDE